MVRLQSTVLFDLSQEIQRLIRSIKISKVLVFDLCKGVVAPHGKICSLALWVLSKTHSSPAACVARPSVERSDGGALVVCGLARLLAGTCLLSTLAGTKNNSVVSNSIVGGSFSLVLNGGGCL